MADKTPNFAALRRLAQRWPIFRPILAGATLRDRLIACFGALIGILVTGFFCNLLLRKGLHVPFLVAPIGASAVLLFAVPSSPLAQPWSIIGGNTLSAVVGVGVSYFVHEPVLAAAMATALAIAVMSLSRCLHPPGGAVALGTTLGGNHVLLDGAMGAVLPVGLNSVFLVGLGLIFHHFSRHSYPHVVPPAPVNTHGTEDLPPQTRLGIRAEDIDAALSDMHESFDVSREDLAQLLRQVELRAFARSHGNATCADVMSRDVITIGRFSSPEVARAILLERGLRTLPVVDTDGRVEGLVTLHELARAADRVGDVMTSVKTLGPESPVFDLIEPLTRGRAHEVVIVDDDHKVIGLVTQTDLIIAISRAAAGTSASV